MKLTMNFIKACCLAVALATSCVANASETAKKFTFDYQIKGQPSINPVQVFDDGTSTFFQFNSDRTIPAIFAVSPCGAKMLLTPTSTGTYLVVAGRFAQFSLQLGNKTSTVEYSGKNIIPLDENLVKESCEDISLKAKQQASVRTYTSVKPVLGEDPVPAKLDMPPQSKIPSDAVPVATQPIGAQLPVIARAQTQAMANSVKHSKKTANRGKLKGKPATPEQQGQTIQKQQQVQAAPADPTSNVVSDKTSIQAQTPKLPVVETWEIKSGQSLRQCLEEWRTRAGWEMVWNYEGKFVSQANATFEGNFEAAVRNLVAALPDSMNIKIELAANKLIYVTGGKK